MQNNDDVINISNIFNGTNNVFIDAVHFNKTGSKIEMK